MKKNPHIVLVVARGEAVRNFLYSDTVANLSNSARVTLISSVDHGEVIDRVRPYVDRIIHLREYKERRVVSRLRRVVHEAHLRWINSEAAKYYKGLHDSRARSLGQKFRRRMLNALASLAANRPTLRLLTSVERFLSYRLRPTRHFDELFDELRPDLVFNCSHIHGPQADLPCRVAAAKGLPTATFVFSWDNLTSRSRIFVPYDYFFVWTERIRGHFLRLYPNVAPERVKVTGTPQFDFHFKPEFRMTREALCAELGLDPKRPFVLYTTGLDTDFPYEHRVVEAVIRTLRELDVPQSPQLVVRTYVKGTSPEMIALAENGYEGVVFPPILWDRKWMMPLYEDLKIYSSLLHHCALGINVASTVSLELLLLDKPVINIGYEPAGSDLPHWSRFSRHVEYEHYRPVVASGAVMLARAETDLPLLIRRGLLEPHADAAARRRFVDEFFGGPADGQAGRRVAEQLLKLGSWGE